MAGVAVVSYTKMVCPDEECQKLVEAALSQDHDKRVETAKQKERSMQEHKRALARARAKTTAAATQ